ncbi:hypothetical protein [Streptomyces monashensis]|uniref:ABC transporter n=1 Tax=Streptomyces monashensis TaxID=1678012 RepID=A0A1S2QIT8_9ACTN|nr:hypothetical protein [Streptomyces monashensis]OIK05285.1 hypothetical protein BIV23_13605 [Streptomyces monashensis]
MTHTPWVPASAGHRPAVPEPRHPDCLIRLRFADAVALERADLAFGSLSDLGFADVRSDPATLTLQIAGDAGIESLRAVLAVLDTAAITAEALTVHTHELDDVFAAFTGLPATAGRTAAGRT